MNIGTEYKGYKIEYSEMMNIWEMDIGGTTKSRGALSDAKKYIDTLEKRTKKFSPVSAYLENFRQGKRFVPVTITSEGSMQYGYPAVWVKTDDKSRRKVKANDVILATPENKATMEKVNSVEDEREHLRKSVAELLKSMERYRPEDKA